MPFIYGGIEVPYSAPKPTPVKARPKPKPRSAPRRPNPNRKAIATAKARAAALARQRARAAEAKQRALSSIAVAKARQAALIRSRSIAYESLRDKQLRVSNQFFQGKPVSPRPMVKGPASEMVALREETALLRARQAENAAKAKLKRAQLVESGSYLDRRGGSFDTHYSVKGDAQTGIDIETQIRLESSAAYHTGSVDTAYLEKLQKKYESHATTVYSDYEKRVAQINAALASGNVALAKKLYRDAKFISVRNEFTRLFGSGKNPLQDGSYNKFWKDYQDISLSQNKWWKSQLRSSLQAQLSVLKSQTGPKTKEQAEDQRIIQAQVDAFNGKTGLVQDGIDPNTGERLYRSRTVDEELAYQQSLIIMRREKEVAQRLEMDRRLRKDMVLNGQVFYQGQVVRREDVPVLEGAKRLKESHPELFPDGGVKNAEDVQRLTDGLMEQWDREHPKPHVTFHSGSNSAEARAYRLWQDQRSEYEKHAYNILGKDQPEWWDRIAGLPAVSHGLSLLQAPNAAIGAGGRILTGLFSGDSTKIGIGELNWAEAPSGAPTIAKVSAEAKRLGIDLRDRKNQYYMADTLAAKQNAWLQTPEGKKWAADQKQQNVEESYAQDVKFQKGFYGENSNAFGKILEDPGAALRTLNTYGQAPFQNDAANLLFQLLADPTNAVPLKATTYLARGKYALEAAQDAKGLFAPTAKASVFMKKFLAVDEGTLKKIMAGEQAVKDWGKYGSLEKFVDEYRAITAGIEEGSHRKSVFEAVLRKGGVLPREAPEGHLFNIIEQLVVSRAADKGLSLLTEVEKHAKLVEDAIKKADEAAAAEAEAARVKSLLSKPGEEIKDARQSSAREVLSSERRHAQSIKKGEPIVDVAKGTVEPIKGTVGSRLRAAFPDRKQKYFDKDVLKATTATKFIGHGAEGSSTADYAKALGGSDTTFTKEDRVFVSANGRRKDAVQVVSEEGVLTSHYKPLDDAIEAQATILTDVPADRLRPYNSGERVIASYLEHSGYEEVHPGVWMAPEAAPTPAAARFGRDARGNATVPSVWKHEDGYVYRTMPEGEVNGGLKPFMFASHKVQTIYAEADSVIVRMKVGDSIPAEGGVNALDNVIFRDGVSASDLEVLSAEGKWIPATTGSWTPEARLAAEASGRPPFPDPFTGDPRPFTAGASQASPVSSGPVLEHARRALKNAKRDLEAYLDDPMSAEVGTAEDLAKKKSVIAALEKTVSDLESSGVDVAADEAKVVAEKTAAEAVLERQAASEAWLDPDAPMPSAYSDPLEAIPVPAVSESSWLRKEKFKAYTVLSDRTAAPAARKAARDRVRIIEDAEGAIKKERKKSEYVRKVVRSRGDEVVDVVPPNMIAPLVTSARDAAVEQVRTLRKRLMTTPVGPVESSVQGITVADKQLDHIPKKIYDDVHQRVTLAIREARGIKNELLTKQKGKGGSPAESVLDEDPKIPKAGSMSDFDPLVIAAKKKALNDYYKETGIKISVAAYDEARHVLWRAVLQDMNAKKLLMEARLYRKIHGGTVEEAYLHLRGVEAKKESLRQLQAVAREMAGTGADHDAVLKEFMRRYSDDGVLYHPATPLSPFQRATIENYIKDASGLTELEGPLMNKFLASANRPPLENRELTKGFLTRIGAWSPRKSELFLKDAVSWSVEEEARYWYINYGEIPEWADTLALARGNKEFFRNDALHYAQLRAWGFFNRAADLELRASGKTAEEIEEINIAGGRRTLAEQRKYAFERYGRMVSADGKTLDEMPWLMTDDEYRRYIARITATESLPPHFIQNAAELDEVTKLINQALDPLFEKFIASKAVDGVVDYADLLRAASQIQATLLANPKWLKRHRDIFGNALNAWGSFNRWLVFSNPAFLVTNVIDAPLKTAYYRFTRRGLFNPGLRNVSEEAARRANEMTPASIGYDATSAMYREKQASPLSRILNPRGYTDMERAVDRALGVFHASPLGGQLYPTIAGRVELIHQMALARGMYPQWFEEGVRRFGDTEIGREAADAFAKKNIADEARRMWPTAGNGPVEQLWNRIVPFATYSIRNKVLFISEAIGHPALLNYIDAIGRYIEEENLKNWNEDPETAGKEMPEHLRRRIELPWAPGFYLDLATFSDASRGLSPLFRETESKSWIDLAGSWIRIVNPGPQAGIYALFNAFNLFPKFGWVADENGVYHKVNVGWTEPWSKDAPDAASVFWMVDLFDKYEQYNLDGISSGDANLLIGQALFFNGISTYDKNVVLNQFYFSLKASNPESAKEWLKTEEGLALRDWWESKAGNPKMVLDMIHQLEVDIADSAKWFHDQSKEFQAKVTAARNEITAIRSAFYAELSLLTPGTVAYREMKARMYMAINNVYLNTPEMMQADVYSKSAADWSVQLEDWATDKLMDDFMALDKVRPARSDYKDVKSYNKAVDEWELQKQIFLRQYPQVAERLNAGRTQLDHVRDVMNAEWDRILTRVASRNEAIEAAKQIIADSGRVSAAGRKAQDYLDRAYLMNELDFSLLERDYAATYFSPDDFERLPTGASGPAVLKGNILQRATTLLDFDRTRYEKALREGRLDEFLAEQQYGESMRKAIAYAKRNDPFGEFDPKRFSDYMLAHPDVQKDYFANNPAAEKKFKDTSRYIEGIRALWNKAGNDPAKWVSLLKKDPWLLAEYFRRNPGKQQKWARTDAYIRNISVWGKLIGAGKFDAANAAWDRLPQWVKDQYLAKHPEKRKQSQQTATYLGYMDKWVKLFDDPDKNKAMAYFNSLPQWAKDRYFAKHPDKKIKFGQDAKMSKKLVDYFGMEKDARPAYLKQNPDLAAWLAKNSGSKSSERMAILAAYREIPSDEPWLKRVFRERYPEIFSKEAIGEQKLRKVYDNLARHPEMTESFEAWVKAIWETYAENMKHTAPLKMSYAQYDRSKPARRNTESLSAAEADRLSKRRAQSYRNV